MSSRLWGAGGSGGRNAELDGLRACAALSVLAYHVASWSGLTQGPGLETVASALKGGVALFFVISGYVLFLPAARCLRDGTPPRSPSSFLIRRAARIAPAYWVALGLWLALAAVSGAGLPSGPRSAELWRYFLFAQIYSSGTIPGGLGVAWTLCIEVTFYVLLVVLIASLAHAVGRNAAAGARRWAGPTMLAAGGLFGIACVVRLGFAGSLFARIRTVHLVGASALPASLDWFALGIGLAVVVARIERAGVIERGRIARMRPLARGLAVVLLLASIPVQGGDLYLPLDSLAAHLLLGIGSALLVLGAVLPDSAPRRTLLGSAPVAWLGRISYGIYLYHLPAILLTRRLVLGLPSNPTHISALPVGSVILLTLAAGAGGIGFGALSWYAIERPAQRSVARVRGIRMRALAGAARP